MADGLSFDAVRDAAIRIAGAISITPCRPAPRLTAELGVATWLKLEQLQFTGSFKERGALNALLQLTPEERKRGVIAASAGNHAQGLAYHARSLEIETTIVMPINTPQVKVRRTRSFGARVVLEGATYGEAAVHAQALAIVTGAVMVHPYDHLNVMAGGGTVALEMLRQSPEIDTLVIPVGGGGLIAGMACAAKAIRPDVRVYGVRAEAVPRGNVPVADGIAVDALGENAEVASRGLVDGWITVNEAAIDAAMHRLMQTEKIVTEGAGAAALAGVMRRPELFAGRNVGIVISGGNVDAKPFSEALGRAERDPAQSVSLRAHVVDAPGALARVAAAIAQKGADALDVARRSITAIPPNSRAELDVTIEVRYPC